MPHKLVKDIMVPLEEYPCVSEKRTLRDAIAEMGIQISRQKQLSLPRVALVFDENRRELRGILRRRDIMRGLAPRFLLSGSLDYRNKLFDVEVDPNLAELAYDKMLERIRQRSDLLVGKFMVPINTSIHHDDHVMKAINEMVESNTSLLPVLENDRVVGVVRSVDVLGELAVMINP